MERGIRKCLAFVIRQIASKIFWKIIRKPLQFRRLKFPQDARTDANVIAPLRMCLYGSKSTLDSLKSVLTVFRRNTVVGCPCFMLRHLLNCRARCILKEDHINILSLSSSYHAFTKDADTVIGSIGCASSSICNGTQPSNCYLISESTKQRTWTCKRQQLTYEASNETSGE